MKLHISLFLFPFALFVLSSCEYEPSEFYKPKVNKDVTPPEIQVVQLDLQQDTINLFTSQNVNFQFISSNQNILYVIFSIDSTQKTIYNKNFGSYNLDWYGLEEGIHKLKIEIFTKTGTNSIAEKLGAEAFVFSTKEWTIFAHKQYKLKNEIRNGFLTLSWPKYYSSSLKEYVLSFTSYQSYNKKEICRTKLNFFIDTLYIGEGGTYTIEIYEKDNTKKFQTSITINPDLPELKFLATKENKYYVTWNSIKFKSIESIKLTSFKSSIEETIKCTKNPLDTLYNITDGIFNEIKQFKFYIMPKHETIRSSSPPLSH